MKKNVYLAIISVLLIGILVSGAKCEPLRKRPSEEVEEPSMLDLSQIRQGTEGLDMEFVKNVPPDQVYDNDFLTVMVNVKNKGAESVYDAWFYLGGFDRTIVPFDIGVEGIPLSETDAIEGYIPGKDELRGEEGEVVLTFGAQLRGLPGGTDVYEPNIILTACYNYKTIANPIVCIDPNPFGVYTASKVCQPRTVSETGGQGAPIAVTRVELVPSRGKIQFKIFVENKRDGKAISSDKGIDQCTMIEPIDYKYVNKIDSYNVWANGLSEIRCQPDPENLRLVDDKGVIVCSFDISPDDVPAYTTPLNIELEYNYMESTKPKKVKILRI
ncbi:hypothetical protein KY345_04395 [Candidatus Woesearchaeota archaeon]|nr:hypothetical protein [Candidatus Woesearchaeota archaeon]